jgi:hypothetical protein
MNSHPNKGSNSSNNIRAQKQITHQQQSPATKKTTAAKSTAPPFKRGSWARCLRSRNNNTQHNKTNNWSSSTQPTATAQQQTQTATHKPASAAAAAQPQTALAATRLDNTATTILDKANPGTAYNRLRLNSRHSQHHSSKTAARRPSRMQTAETGET